jgi:hypothetical protein
MIIPKKTLTEATALHWRIDYHIFIHRAVVDCDRDHPPKISASLFHFLRNLLITRTRYRDDSRQPAVARRRRDGIWSPPVADQPAVFLTARTVFCDPDACSLLYACVVLVCSFAEFDMPALGGATYFSFGDGPWSSPFRAYLSEEGKHRQPIF